MFRMQDRLLDLFFNRLTKGIVWRAVTHAVECFGYFSPKQTVRIIALLLGTFKGEVLK